MATKFYNNNARVFNKLLQGADSETLLNEEFKKIDEMNYSCNEDQANEYKKSDKKELLEVKAFFEKIKFFEKPEKYSVNGWGYGQTNYENLIILGQVGGSMVCILDNNHSDVYTISKSKYTKKEKYTSLDKSSVRSTSWCAVYSSDAIRANNLENSYCGH